MADIISLENKFQEAREKKVAADRKRKLQAVRAVLQEAKGILTCEKCHQELDDEAAHRERDLRVPYVFCDSCAEEYVDYIERLQGRGDQTCYWRNRQWFDVWRRWIDYRGTIDTYLQSKEFRQLLEELKQVGPFE
ncbi:hypothetical protein B2D07_02950 [Desulfococcus multivorans]|uniref:Uncharacterized protein n=2 Tax=Desulfococcaceae TaxID=2931039 RepID=S7V5S9_DESML|nr:conserved uncharacterized protein [Desulfococcus multivorans]AQU99833.2 hypothetical protein B2D07_02950 [Desulfococcus multivorans]EPR42019.1 hypothetical protein dsmv_1746 [Desulfococcus multivorans DSM 2059]SKA10094.1 hypothetical protein SAMN02745446_02770 [Desulfococcus multivorans DSM 2059]